MAQLWWQNIGEPVSGEVIVDTAMDNLAHEQDKVLARIARSGVQGDCGPRLNDEIDAEQWLGRPGTPKAKLANEKPRGRIRRLRRLAPSLARGLAVLRPDVNAERRIKGVRTFLRPLFWAQRACLARYKVKMPDFLRNMNNNYNILHIYLIIILFLLTRFCHNDELRIIYSQ